MAQFSPAILMAMPFLILGILPINIDGLRCYQCADDINGGPCQTDHDQMEKVAQKIASNASDIGYLPYYKVCPVSEDLACAIEEIRFKGETTAFIRGCSDGKTFSINDIEKFNNSLNLNNHTTCAYKINVGVVCITLCNGQDMCNGPRFLTMTSSGHNLSLHFVLIFMISTFTVYFLCKSFSI